MIRTLKRQLKKYKSNYENTSHPRWYKYRPLHISLFRNRSRLSAESYLSNYGCLIGYTLNTQTEMSDFVEYSLLHPRINQPQSKLKNMRKITQRATSAFLSGKPFKEGNTEVTVDKAEGYTISTLYLHGNAIASWDGGKLEIRSAGWETNTTKERLNALPNVCIHQSKFKWYLNGELWTDSSKWTEVN